MGDPGTRTKSPKEMAFRTQDWTNVNESVPFFVVASLVVRVIEAWWRCEKRFMERDKNERKKEV